MPYFQPKDDIYRNVLNTLSYFIEYTKKCPSNYINFPVNRNLYKEEVYRNVARGYFNCEYLIKKDDSELYNDEMATKYIQDIFNSKENQKAQFKTQEKDEYALCFPFYHAKDSYISPLFFIKVDFRKNKATDDFEISLGEISIVESTLSRIIREKRILDEDSEHFIKVYSEMVQNINSAIIDLGDLSCYTIYNLSQKLIQIFTTYVCDIDRHFFICDRFMILSDITIFISNKIYKSFMDVRDKIISKNTTKPLANYLGLEPSKAYGISDVPKNIHRGGYFTTYTVNEKQAKIISALNQSNLLSISGPPGTGKTTILKEIIADYAVRRAGVLIQKMESGETQLTPQELHSIIVTSSQNKAVDNIGDELSKEVDFFHFAQDHGYFCARLGNKNNIDICVDQFEQLKKHLSDICDDESQLDKYRNDFEIYSNYYRLLQYILDRVEELSNCDIIHHVSKILNMSADERRQLLATTLVEKHTKCFNDVKAACSDDQRNTFDLVNISGKYELDELHRFIKEIYTKANDEIVDIEKKIQPLQENIRTNK